MDSLENYITHTEYPLEVVAKRLLWLLNNDPVHDTHIAISAEVFGVFSSFLSLVVGVFSGLSTYARVTKIDGEAKMAKALGLAGTASVIGAATTGYVLGLTLEGFLSITPNIDIMYISISWMAVVTCITAIFEAYLHFGVPLFFCLSMPLVAYITFLIIFFSKCKLVLTVALFPTFIAACDLGKTYDFQLIIAPVLLMLVLTDAFTIASQPIISLQPPTSTNTSSIVLEDIYIEVLTSQLLVVAIGMSLFVSW